MSRYTIRRKIAPGTHLYREITDEEAERSGLLFRLLMVGSLLGILVAPLLALIPPMAVVVITLFTAPALMLIGNHTSWRSEFRSRISDGDVESVRPRILPKKSKIAR